MYFWFPGRCQLCGHACAQGLCGAADRAAALRRARAVLHLQVERLLGGAALPCDHAVRSVRQKPAFIYRIEVCKKGENAFSWLDVNDPG